MLKVHDLYGQSFAHEFQFTNPDSIKNAVKRYNLQRAAERDEYNRDKETHKMNKLRFCKMRNSGNDVLGMVTSRDLDVETQMSLATKDTTTSSVSSRKSSRTVSRTASSQSCSGSTSYHEIEAPIMERLAGGADTVKPRGKPRAKTLRSRKQKRGATKQNKVATPKVNMDDAYAAHIEGLHREVCAELQDIAPAELQGSFTQRSKSKACHNQKKKKIQQPLKNKPKTKVNSNGNANPKPEKIVPQQLEQDKIMERLKQVLSVSEQMQQDAKQMSYQDYRESQAQWQDIIPTPLMPQMMNADLCRALNTTPSMACLFMQQHGLPCGMEAEPPFVEDSDLEQEIADRPGYMRYIERLPYNPSDALDTPSSQNACFEELEPHPHWIRLQRSLKPMHYTSQRSDTDTLTLCDTQEQAEKTGQAFKRPKTKPVNQQPPHPKKSRPKGGQQVVRQPGERENQMQIALLSNLTPTTPTSTVANATGSLNMQRRRKSNGRNVICTRSLENLKYEKMAIYNKISLTQERIITALDRLQGKLLQLQMPTCSNQEKQRRERNAFKFCVKFSRNFLFPLRGLIEDVRATPVASFNSATSNEASQRVVCVYSLMFHSIGNYKRQLRFFLLDKVPQKLSALIEMMYTLTNICLEKGVLDRQDPVVESLQQRCTSFLTFIEDMQQERFQLARENYRRLQKRIHHAHGTGRSGTRERYDLKMFLNDLKLYEPRLVPKERPEKRRQRGWIRRPKLEKPTNNAPSQTRVAIEPAAEKMKIDPVLEVPTHIECVQCGDYHCEPSSEYYEPSSEQKDQLTNILALLQEPRQEKRELHQQLLEAMEHVTKSQVREVLDPLVRSLGAILDKKMGDHFN
ncbi:uncharacterized protein LOC117793842 [Drosophila innubila]|uniref:uncharacterized protein LOC117793842 n=1 Tax=Drosophila innubila TaxID=198719 RepID=UPI00148B913B|nr:uncharacterized protein LOC117793842 [Drosophila innubila]